MTFKVGSTYKIPFENGGYLPVLLIEIDFDEGIYIFQLHTGEKLRLTERFLIYNNIKEC